MEDSIKVLEEEVVRLESKTNGYLLALKQLQEQLNQTAQLAAKNDRNAAYQLKTLLKKCRLIKRRYHEKSELIERLNQKINMLQNNDMTFTVEDVMGFEEALNNSNGKELQIDRLNPLFSNLKFLRVLRNQLETHEIYEKCALLQKRIEKLNVD